MTSVLYDVPGPRARVRARITSWVTGLIVVGALAYAALTLGEKGMWDASRWMIFNDPLVWAALLRGLLVVVQSALVATVLALLLGMVFSLLRMSSHRIIRIPTTVVLEFFRGMPVLLMMLFILLAFPGISAFWAVVSALAVYNGAIIGEALRSGVVALPKGQREAGLAIGMRPLQTRLQIEFPQAFRNMLPIIVAQIVVLTKDTALGYIVGAVSLIREGELLGEFLGRQQYFFPIFLVMVAMYLALNLTISTVARQLAKRRGVKVASVVQDESLSALT
ncbi:amino acid ABC transporter permease [Subtercola boreus]|uniref:Glutamate ABC transporter permease n=1 Tax=Subtercola boreus TaxID=120213 RepID=A0A3E0WDT5_9MICO|nr:ABC transporter permease subunit [Subtercola boreus]RFA21851.1 glutamate ABC transporter permease [Subtercola boreus]RFA21962.1 glutamate ABC transporter permease [Subtercola boreus]RFA27910.1 glutamate ABC transporter permease [Subtercola boreus]